MSDVSKSDKFSQQARAAVIGALALGLGLSYSSCAQYLFVLHDQTQTISVLLQFSLLLLFALLFTLLLFAVLTLWDTDATIVRVF